MGAVSIGTSFERDKLMTQNFAQLAAIEFAQDEAADALLEDVARQLQKRGIKVAGLIQRAQSEEGQCCGAVFVEDIVSAKRWQIMQPLGQHARGCRLNPQEMVNVSVWALNELQKKPDILFLNRFGKGEAEGSGLRSVFEAASLDGIPVLTSVKETYRPAWDDFAAGLSVSLSPELSDVLSWCMTAVEEIRLKTSAA